MSYFVYIVECSDQSLYTGYSTDVQKRVEVHNKKQGAKYTRSRLPVRLVYQEECESLSQALKRERQIKKLSRSQKLRLIKKRAA